MIVVDSSALCAVFFNEPEKSAFQAIRDSDERCVLSAVNARETARVLCGKLGQGGRFGILAMADRQPIPNSVKFL